MIARWSVLLACVVLSACQLASGLDKLHTRKSSIGRGGEAALEGVAGMPSEPPSAAVGGSGGTREDSRARVDAAAVGGGGGREPIAGMRVRSEAGRATEAGGGGLVGAAVSGGAGGMSGAAAKSQVAGSDASSACTAPLSGGASCDPVSHCGCASNESCALYAGHLACVQVGSAQPNTACNTASDCMRGYQCDRGACLRSCDQTHPNCEGGAMCDAIWGDDGKPIPGVFDCDSNCNLVQPESDAGGFHACGPGLTCYVSPNGSACTKRTGGGVHGQLCDGGAGCANGYACLRDGTCGKWCIGASDCPAGYTCDTSINRRVASTDFGLCVPDGCDRPTSGACGPNPQCGCGSGMSCDVMVNAQAQAVYACRAVGSTSAWAACDLQTDCPRGTSCVDNQCQPFCTTDASCGEPYTICRQVFPPLSNPPKISGFTSCARPCDPYQPTQMAAGYSPCSEGSACSPSTDGRSYCREIKNAGGSGDACSQQTDCGAGFVCMNSDSGGALCQLLCRVNSSDCSRGRCLGLDPKVYVGNVEWGTCVL